MSNIIQSILYDSSCYVEAKVITYRRDLNITDKYGDTALIIASRRGYFIDVAVLLRYGANVNIQNNTGDTALIVASKEGVYHIVKELLNNGSDIHIKNNNNQTAFDVTTDTKIKTLLSNKYEIDSSLTKSARKFS